MCYHNVSKGGFMMDIILSAVEIRILGSLIEKEITTPEYYPLSLNSLTTACSQKSNRTSGGVIRRDNDL